ncbi:MAG: extracellular solute-binding protein, partial [Candidatus Rokubacteria bacterium]|nr:extracellular solute-binding protein [Candidatus Rokubacteria bacterium]
GLPVPDTWEDLYKVGKELKKMGHPVGIPISQNYDSISTAGPVLWSLGGMEIDKDGKTVRINSPQTVEMVEWYKKMFRDCMEPEVLSWNDASNNESITAGKAGWIHNPISAYLLARNKKMVTADGINHHRSLAGPQGRHDTDVPRHMGIWKFSKNIEASKEWIRYLLGKKEVYDEYIVSGDAFNLPVYTNLQDHPVLKTDPKFAAVKPEGVQLHAYGWPAPPSDKVQQITNLFVLPNMIAKAVPGTPTKEAIAWAVARRSLRVRVRELIDREKILGPVFVTPALLLLVLLVAYPFAMALYFSVSNAFIGRPSHFIGVQNFVNLWQSDAFRQTFQNAFVFTGSAVAIKLVLGISLALLLNQQLWFKRAIRGAVLLPWVIPTALSTLGWWWMFSSLYSVVNWTGIAVGIMDPPGPNWLGQKYYAMTAVVAVNVWRGLPFFAITILAGLVSIPRELYEAAEADGAGPVGRFWYVTLPMLKPVLAIVVLFSTIFTFSDFNIVYVLTHGGPINSTHLFATLARQIGLETGRIAEGAAISLYLFPLLVFVVYAQLKFVRKEVY